MTNEEAQVFADFKKYANVAEAWALYDTVAICNTMFGTEANIGGWFTTWAAFGARERHSFFKTRTEGLAGLQYCNMQSADSMDFAFIASSIGIAFMAPAGIDSAFSAADGIAPAYPDMSISQFWTSDVPYHCSVELKIQQDTRVECAAMQLSPGYGAAGSGAAFGHTDAAVPVHNDIPFMSNFATQGVPVLSNRFPLPVPIGIPRTASIEVVVQVSQYIRDIMQNIGGPNNIYWNTSGVNHYDVFPARYLMQVSLFGKRLVQQRGEYHR